MEKAPHNFDLPLWRMEASEHRKWEALENSIEIFRERLDGLRKKEPDNSMIADTAREVMRIMKAPFPKLATLIESEGKIRSLVESLVMSLAEKAATDDVGEQKHAQHIETLVA